MGKHIVVRGIVEELEHGTYIRASPKCAEGPSAIFMSVPDMMSYNAAGGRKDHGITATVTGELVMSHVGVPQFVKKPYLAISARAVRYERPKETQSSPLRK